MTADKGAHHAVAVAIESGALKLAGSAASRSSGSTSRRLVQPHPVRPDRVRRRGPHGEKVELLQHARATLFPIEWDEPFGLVIESMACGAPLIATRYGAVSEVIEDGVTGVIVESPREMGAALERADALDPHVQRRAVEERFSPRMVGRLRSPTRRRSSVGPTRPADPVHLRSGYDRRILRLALPALGALAAEPLYILVDTAIVGHLGRAQLAALGRATALSVLAMFNFLQYGDRPGGAGGGAGGPDAGLGAQALWLSLGIGVIWRPRSRSSPVGSSSWSASRADGRVRGDLPANRLDRRAVVLPCTRRTGLPARRLGLTSPLVLIVLGNVLNLVLEVLFVYGFDWGIEAPPGGRLSRSRAWGSASCG